MATNIYVAIEATSVHYISFIIIIFIYSIKKKKYYNIEFSSSFLIVHVI